MDLQTYKSTLSESNQTAVPSMIRKLLELNAGDKLIWKLGPDGKSVKIKAAPKLWGSYMRGVGKNIWKGIDVEKYIREGRQDRKIT